MLTVEIWIKLDTTKKRRLTTTATTIATTTIATTSIATTTIVAAS